MTEVPATGLPVEEVIAPLLEALARRGIAVLQAPPGAGKTTVVPLGLLDQPWLGGGRIVVLEPRRVAARAAAARMAVLLGEEVGERVGYRTRDDRRVGSGTRIEVVTEGILTRRLQADPSLSGTAAVIFDEFHERSLHSDLGLALTLDARSGLRPDLRVLAMSATLAAAAVAETLGRADGNGPAPVVASEGRSHPVAVVWGSGAGMDVTAPVTATIGLIRRALDERAGDILAFLPGAGEIARVAGALHAAGLDGAGGVRIHPLHGSLPAADQDAALAPVPGGQRKVVLATDLAETSLTVEGVTVVVDAGLARVPLFDPGSGLTRLHTARASRASADQRAGRAGRREPGTVYRWWSESDHATRAAFARPEIRSVDLDALALELGVWGAAPSDLIWLDPPPEPALAEARRLLVRLGALEPGPAGGRPEPVMRATAAGRAMAELPVHPRLARMVLEAGTGRRQLAATLAALIEERDIFRGELASRSVDAGERLAALSRRATPAGVDARAAGMVRRRARELAARAGVSDHGPSRHGDSGRQADRAAAEPTAAGPLLALAYPDRLAQARGGGRFRLRDGPAVSVPAGDPLGAEAFLVVAEATPAQPGVARSRDGRVRLAAALDEADVEAVGGAEVLRQVELVWINGEPRQRVRRVLGELVLSETTGPPVPGPALAAALAARAGEGGLAALRWGDEARRLQERILFARTLEGDSWPDVSDGQLAATTDRWLAPLLVGARGSADVAAVRMAGVLRSMLPGDGLRRLDRLAPAAVELGNGRRATVDFGGDRPTIRLRAQDLYGVRVHPAVGGGRVPLVVEVLSPAGRPIQVTSDLPGFWAGSWAEVRREMAGRYPKHDWPADPAAASARARGGRMRP